ncbi:winged helix-turn-helix domain-containing protein [Streptomyces jumonjinensis]|uniref:winged helix-turn-helix domain-containing protein n=1 Tax=Streptomyces jumonjinensis TaxID=1945 RepID=UPI001295F5B8|nr:winged helix-turn-helix domain-containing protein [Streptomyces jumonjinensis]
MLARLFRRAKKPKKPKPPPTARPAYTGTGAPRILIGAVLLAALSLAWSGYAITDLMESGPFGLSVAFAGDIGWLTVLWAEYHRVPVAGRTWIPRAAGWAIALGVGALLVLHGIEEDHLGQTIAGPLVVLVGKGVWEIALPALRDPTRLTDEQQAEIHSVMRDSEHTARINAARRTQVQAEADAAIERIRQQARITAARDQADFEIALDRLEMRAEIDRRSPLALSYAAQPADPQAQPAAERTEPPAEPVEPEPSTAPLVLTSSLASPTEPPAQPGEPFGFSAHLSAQSAQRFAAVEKVAELLDQDPGLTSAQVAERLEVSSATAKRYLREARTPRRPRP